MSDDVNDVLGVAHEALHQAHVQAQAVSSPLDKTSALLDVVDRAVRVAETMRWISDPPLSAPDTGALSLGYRDGVLGSRTLAQDTGPKLWEGKD